MFVFGSGVLIGTPSSGTPVNFGLVQEVSLDINITNKELFGQYAFPVAIGQGTRKLNGKAKLAKLSPEAVKESDLAGEPITAKLTNAPGNNAPIGGLKVVAANGWFAARPSGTEDVYKIYAESFKDRSHLESILAEAQAMVDGALKGA